MDKKSSTIKNQLLEIEDLKLDEQNVLRSKNMLSIKLIREFCSVDAFEKIENVKQNFLKKLEWKCGKCFNTIKSNIIAAIMKYAYYYLILVVVLITKKNPNLFATCALRK